MNELLRYFPDLTDEQTARFEALQALYTDWNQKINVISRKDIGNLYTHHVLHSLAISRALHPVEGTRILDFGTGGGFPGIPLAILWPDCQFHLIDGTGKKIHVVEEVARAIGPKNVRATHIRGEEEKGHVSAETAPFKRYIEISELSDWITDEWFQGKHRIYLPL